MTDSALRVEDRNQMDCGSQRRALNFLRMLACLISVFVATGLAEADPPLSVEASSEVSAALYAASATQEAFARTVDVQMRAMRAEIEALKLEVLNGTASAQRLAEREREFVDALATRDRAYAQEISVFRNAVEDIASTPEGLQALVMFNDGDELGAIAILDDLRAARAAARQKRADVETAAEARRIANLALEARNSGKLSTQDVIARFEEITGLDPDVHWDWIELSRLYLSLGNMDSAKRSAHHAAQTAQSDRDLSTALNELGDILLSKGELDDAQDAFGAALALALDNVAEEPANLEWHRDIFVLSNRAGDVFMEQGDYDAAFESHEISLMIARRLAEIDPSQNDRARDLSVALSRLGETKFVLGDLENSLAFHKESFEIARQLASLDPSNAELQRDVSISMSVIGDIKFEKDDLAAALDHHKAAHDIAERLVAMDPGNAVWQRDLSVSYERLGDTLELQGDLTGALENYQASVKIAEALAEIDVMNETYQEELSIGLEKSGLVKERLGDSGGALADFEAALAIAASLATSNPTDVEAQRDHWLLLWKLRQMEGTTATWLDVVQLMESLDAAGTLQPDDYQWLDMARTNAEAEE
ncbi:MAG: tetratricopeptide repeat protein [Pseudomonadota bacterium]